MTQNPLVSVVIPTFNRATTICRTIDNVLEQTYRNFEVIIVDDGSSDDTVPRLRQRYGDRIQVVTQSNAGPAVARNHGARVAKGEIIAFQDSDDLWKPAKLARQVALLSAAEESVPCCLSNAEMGVIHGKERTTFEHSSLFPQHEEGLWLNPLQVLATRFVLFNQCVAIRRSAFERAGGFDEKLKYLEDYDLPLRLSLAGPWTFVREPLVIYCGASDGSFSQQALKDPFTLKDCELTIFGEMLRRVGDGEHYADAKRYLDRRLRMFRRAVTELRLGRKRAWWARRLARVMAQVGHYQEALFRHSADYPKMATSPLVVQQSSDEMRALVSQ